jgi:DNA-binding CsgD family transcriptional regulator
MQNLPESRDLVQAECYTPEALYQFLADIEQTESSVQVWQRLVQLSVRLGLPFVDFITASSYADWKKTLFIRTSYDSTWLQTVNQDPDLHKWSYFRSHAMHYLTPIAVGIEFVDEYHHIPATRVEVLRLAASKGIRSGFSVPLRVNAPPQAALITFSGDHAKRDMLAIIKAHGWTLNVAAMVAHQRYISHFAAEFSERNEISEKQSELLEKIGLGLQDKAIAQELGVSISAVRQRMHLLMQKTGQSNRAELAALAMSMGILPDPLIRSDESAVETLVVMDNIGSRKR